MIVGNWGAKALLIGVCMVGLIGCQTTTGDTSTPPVQGTAPALSSAPSSAPQQTVANLSETALISFELNNSGIGGYYGWQLQVTRAANNAGFIPFISNQLSSGQIQRFEVWPDRYAINVYRLGDLQYSGWVDVHPAQITVIYADFGLLFDDVKINNIADPALYQQAKNIPALLTPISSTYSPQTIQDTGGYRFEYRGPQQYGKHVGTGTVTISEAGKEFATIGNAALEDTGISGRIQFADNRTTDGTIVRLNGIYQLAPETRTIWPDGQEFTGRYQVFTPADGLLRMVDGTSWKGALRNERPFGAGRVMFAADGWIDLPSGEMFPNQTGTFSCGGKIVPVGECYYHAGTRLASAAELDLLIERDLQTAAKDVKQPRQQATDAPPATATGCRQASGTFHDTTGNSTLTLDTPGQGRGNFISYTFGGAAKYRFEIDFTYATTPDSISVTYDGIGTYSNAATGEVLQRMTIPSGTVPCQFDRDVLVFDGVEYRK